MTALEIYPPDIHLATSRGRQSYVVRASYADGITRDVTTEAKVSLANSALVTLDKNLLTPLADGKTELQASYGGKTASTPVSVTGAKTDRPISFKLDVMPVFMRAGCNVGGCHGAARGKDGFRLSLFGFDPDGDYNRLTREMSGRRINLAIPEESLILDKAAGRAPHTGGRRLTEDSPHYKTIVRWLEAGRLRIPRPSPRQCRPSFFHTTPFLTVRAPHSKWSCAPLFRRQRTRRDVVGCLPEQQRQLRESFARRDCHRRRAR